jgi:hypothetical protein
VEKHGEPVPLVLKAGQMLLHSDWILHRPEVNQSTRRRCGFAMRFASSDLRAFNVWNQHPIVCRGVEPSGQRANHARPDGEMIPVKQLGANPALKFGPNELSSTRITSRAWLFSR